MKYLLTLSCLLLSFSLFAQSDQEIEKFAKEYYERYKINDTTWVKENFASAEDIGHFKSKKYNRPYSVHNQDYAIRNMNLAFYLNDFSYPQNKELREIIEKSKLVQIIVFKFYDDDKFKSVKIICSSTEGYQFYITPGDISKNSKGQIVFHESLVNVGAFVTEESPEIMPDQLTSRPPKSFGLIEATPPPLITPSIKNLEKEKSIIPDRNNTIYDFVEQMPAFPGGEHAMFKWLANNLEYPIDASTAGISGVVYIQFVVRKDGSIDQAKIIRDIGGGCGAAALRCVKKMPTWQPGINNGMPVHCYFTLPITFETPE